MFKSRKKIINAVLSGVFIIFIAIGSIGGCGTSAPEAPFGSTLTFIPEPEGVSICLVGLDTILVRVLLTDPAGIPLNDVAVTFDVGFAGDNSLLFDTDGDSLGDSSLLQIVDNDACPDDCTNAMISEFAGFGALRNSPFEDITDDFGVAEVLLIVPGFFNLFEDTGQTLAADPATVTVFSGSAVITTDFEVNTECEVPEDGMT